MTRPIQAGDDVRVISEHHTRGELGSVVCTSITPSGRKQVIVRIGADLRSYGAHELERVSGESVIDSYAALCASLIEEPLAPKSEPEVTP